MHRWISLPRLDNTLQWWLSLLPVRAASLSALDAPAQRSSALVPQAPEPYLPGRSGTANVISCLQTAIDPDSGIHTELVKMHRCISLSPTYGLDIQRVELYEASHNIAACRKMYTSFKNVLQSIRSHISLQLFEPIQCLHDILPSCLYVFIVC